jgi:AbrB family looped-hinge helix DNA binding protein
MKMEKILGMAKVTPKGSTTIPAAARQKFKINPGDSLLFIEKDGELVVRKT